MNTYRAKSPVDLAVAAPVLIGFHPEDSVVMISLGGGGSQFHARLDLPPMGYFDQATESLLAPAVRNQVSVVAFLFFTPVVRGVPAKFSKHLYRSFMDAGIEVMDTIRVHDNTVWPMPPSTGASRDGIKFDPAPHPFTLTAAVNDKRVLNNRSDLSHLLTPDPLLVAEFRPAFENLSTASSATLRAFMRRGFERGQQDADASVAVLSWMHTPQFFEAMANIVERANAAQTLEFLLWLVKRTPLDYRNRRHLLDAVALVAWLTGDGALAWTAIERDTSDPATFLSKTVPMLLEGGIPPTFWDEFRTKVADDQ